MKLKYELRKEKTFVYEDLSVGLNQEFAFQTNVEKTIDYDQAYFEDYVKKENTEIANKWNAFRTSISSKYCNSLLDIGIGSGEFIKSSKINVFGYDINNCGIEWLKSNNLFLNPYEDNIDSIDGFTFWDSLEHFYEPTDLLNIISTDKYIFVSLPIFKNIFEIKKSKHYKPNEHISYFTSKGFANFLEKSGYDLIEMSSEEIKSGREEIYTFVAKKIK